MSAKPNPINVILLSIMGIVIISSVVGHIKGTEYTPEIKTTYTPAPKSTVTAKSINTYDTAKINAVVNAIIKYNKEHKDNKTYNTIPIYYYRNVKNYTYDELQDVNSNLQYDLDNANDKIEELESRVAELEAKANE